MKRTHIAALLLLVVATFALTIYLRRSDPPTNVRGGGDAAVDPDVIVIAVDRLVPDATVDAGEEDDEIEVEELLLGDAGEDRKSIRVMHPDPAVQKKLRDWLEPREKHALESKGSLDCLADTATKQLVSIRCVSVAFFDPTQGGGSPNPEYAALTLRIAASGDSGAARAIKELALADVLRAGVGEKEVTEACKKVADPPSPCVWPPTAFSVVHGVGLFICHDSDCVDLDEEADVLRSDLGGRILLH